METMTEILIRAGAVIVFGALFIAFVYLVTQCAPGKHGRNADRKDGGSQEKPR
jgi:hypothetical protein